MTGQEKLALLAVEKAQDLALSLAPKLAQMAVDLGIKNFGSPNVQLPNTCPPKKILDRIIPLRNNLYDKLNNTSKTIENLSKPVDTINTVVTTTSKIVAGLNITRDAALLALEITPPGVIIPGQIITGITRLDDLVKFLNPKVFKGQAIISSISLALDFANAVLIKILSFFRIIDKILAKCAPGSSPPSLSDYLISTEVAVNQAVNAAGAGGVGGAGTTPLSLLNTLYNGFILSIEEVPFSPTVKRLKAVAKNNSGITLLQTPLSFTTTPQVLIEELKLIINSSDLKAY